MNVWTSRGALLALLLIPAVAASQDWKTVQDDEWCDRNDEADWCEVRETTFKPEDGLIRVDSGGNGGIRVEAWDKDEVSLRVRISVHRADDDEEAKEMAEAVEIRTKGRIEPDGPRQRGRGPYWAVSFRLMVPRSSDLDLETSNGGITVKDVKGELDLHSSNGGLSLEDVAGSVRARTTNGGITATFTGERAEGDGIELSTTNGSIELSLPKRFSGELNARTVNGSIRSDFPLEDTNRRRRPTRARTTLGDGGASIELETTNGSVRIHED